MQLQQAAAHFCSCSAGGGGAASIKQACKRGCRALLHQSARPPCWVQTISSHSKDWLVSQARVGGEDSLRGSRILDRKKTEGGFSLFIFFFLRDWNIVK